MPRFYTGPLSVSQILVPPSYVGPGDIVPGALAWYGLRAYSTAAALAGVKAVTVQDTSTLISYDLFVNPNGTLNLTPITGIVNLFVATALYDQTGNGNHMTTQVLSGFPPFQRATFPGSFPSLNLTQAANNSGVKLTTFAGVSVPYSVSVAYMTPDSSAGFGQLFWDYFTGAAGAGSGAVLTRASANTTFVLSNADEPSISTSDGHAHSLNYRNNFPSDDKYVLDNGAPTSLGFTQSTAWGTSLGIGQGFSMISEAGIWGSAISDNGLSALAANQNSYYGTFPI